jgi:hypothetical protein
MFKQNTKTTHSVVQALPNFPCKLHSLLSIPCNYNRTRVGATAACGSSTNQTACASCLTTPDIIYPMTLHLRVVHTIQLYCILLCPYIPVRYVYLLCPFLVFVLYVFSLLYFLIPILLSSLLATVFRFFIFLSSFLLSSCTLFLSFVSSSLLFSYISFPSNVSVVLCLFLFNYSFLYVSHLPCTYQTPASPILQIWTEDKSFLGSPDPNFAAK